MTSSHRRENPSRSEAETSSSSRHKNYRFKSYLEANTQERARFDAMQGDVSDKIAEVIASFREDKLVVQPHRHRPPEVMPEPELERVTASPRLATAASPHYVTPPTRIVASSRAHQRVMWPWYAGGLGLAIAAMLWLDVSGGSHETDVAAPVTAASVVPFAAPALESPPPAPAIVRAAEPVAGTPSPSSDSRSSPAPSVAPAQPAVSAKGDSARPEGTAARTRPAGKAARKPAARKSAPAKDDVHFYSEDLTGLLQGH